MNVTTYNGLFCQSIRDKEKFFGIDWKSKIEAAAALDFAPIEGQNLILAFL